MRVSFRWLAALGVIAALALTGCAGSGTMPEPKDVPEQTEEVSVYYSTGSTLYEEPIRIDATRRYEAVLDTLLKATPELNTEIAIVQPIAKYRSVTFDNGTVTVDWEKDILDFEEEDREKSLALAAILMTYGQFDEVKKVAFTVEGKKDGTIDGKDVEDFWGHVSLKGSPWDVLRPPTPSDETTSTESTSSK